MSTAELLDEVQRKALENKELRETLLATRKEKNPLEAFCRICRQQGYELYPMEVVQAGEEFYATMRRSTNGGGENSPLLEGEDDFYGLLLATLTAADTRQ